MKICLDAGHYGKYNRSPVNSKYYESDMTWNLHLLLKTELEKRGFEVVTTRTNQSADLGLEARGRKSKGCCLFLSLHSNASSSTSADNSWACCLVPDSKTGIDEISADLGKKLADKVTEIMTGKSNSGYVYRRAGNGGTDYYGVLRGAKSVGTPAILMEHGFHTNIQNTEFLLDDENLKKIAVAEADIIAEYFNISSDDKTVSFKPYCIKVISDDGFINIRKTPNWENSDIVGQIPSSNIKYTIIEEKILDGVKFGKLKSGAGWISLHEKYIKKL